MDSTRDRRSVREWTLCELAHQRVGRFLEPGDLALDLTAGNGYDTCFLAQAVSPGGRVLAIDLQARAIEVTKVALYNAGLLAAVDLRVGDHARLAEILPGDWVGKVKAAMLNLGYLPRGEKRVVTRAETTLPALEATWEALAPAGCLSVLAYRGHEEGLRECAAVEAWMAGRAEPCERTDAPEGRELPPVWFFVSKKE